MKKLLFAVFIFATQISVAKGNDFVAATNGEFNRHSTSALTQCGINIYIVDIIDINKKGIKDAIVHVDSFCDGGESVTEYKIIDGIKK